ncbi:hypothetical protein NXW94_30315 [Bacteroides ovatus]|nr:hypothetical protein [Bacteroides ovatus]
MSATSMFLSIVREIVKTMMLDAYALDYCRYPGDDSDFSADSHKMLLNTT